MPIYHAGNAKHGSIPYSSKKKIRAIQREEFTEDQSARAVFLAENAGKLSKGRNESRNRFGGASAGQQIGGGLGGGTYTPAGGAPHNPGNIGTT